MFLWHSVCAVNNVSAERMANCINVTLVHLKKRLSSVVTSVLRRC